MNEDVYINEHNECKLLSRAHFSIILTINEPLTPSPTSVQLRLCLESGRLAV